MTDGFGIPLADQRVREGLRVEVRQLDELEIDDLIRWRALSERALESNPFQQPEFVLPVTANRPPRQPVRLVLAVEAASGEWKGAMLCCEHSASLTHPLGRLAALESAYTFLDGPLVDRDLGPQVIDAWFRFLSAQRAWHSLEFRTIRANGVQQQMFDQAAAVNSIVRVPTAHWNRPEIILSLMHGEPLLSHCSRSRRKSLLRARRWLESRGRLEFRLRTPEPGDLEPLETFLRLEALGWKGEVGTALASSDPDQRFFIGMIQGFARRREAIFGELLIDGEAIASTCNLKSGRELFAFKIGWDPAFAPGNPGHWSELELVTALQREEPGLQRIDGCCPADAYMSSIYPHHYSAGGVAYTWSRRGVALWSARRQVRAMKRSIQQGWATPSAARSGDQED